jgi:hypothetical protein
MARLFVCVLKFARRGDLISDRFLDTPIQIFDTPNTVVGPGQSQICRTGGDTMDPRALIAREEPQRSLEMRLQSHLLRRGDRKGGQSSNPLKRSCTDRKQSQT